MPAPIGADVRTACCEQQRAQFGGGQLRRPPTISAATPDTWGAAIDVPDLYS